MNTYESMIARRVFPISFFNYSKFGTPGAVPAAVKDWVDCGINLPQLPNFVIDRNTLQVKRSLIGNKMQAVSALGDVARRDTHAASLTGEQIGELVKMSLDVETFFGRPMDIEWGWADGAFSLLQARAIRGLEVAEDVEVGRMEEVHRLLELAGNDRKVWIQHNLAETLPAPTPLTWDIIRHFMRGDGGFGKMYKEFGYRPSREVCEEGFLELICGRVYADPGRAAGLFFDGIPLAYNLDEIVKDPKLMDAAPTRFDPQRADGRFLVKLPGFLGATFAVKRITKSVRADVVEQFEQKILPPFLDWARAKRTQDLTALTVPQVLAELHERRTVTLDEFGPESLKPGFFGGVAQAALEGMLVQLMGEQAGTQLAMTVTQGLEGDTTVAQTQMLFDVARGRATMDTFLEQFGHRGVEEMELSRPRWREDSSYVRQILGAYVDESIVSPGARHKENAARRAVAEEGLGQTLAEWGGASLREDILRDLRDAQKMLPYREAGKHYLMMGYETIRLAILELARRWDLGRDVFFLKLPELERFEAERDKCLARIAARKIRWASARQLDMADVIDSNDLKSLGLPRQYEAATELDGEPIASGVSTGMARIVQDPTQTADLCTDYILVCHSTDPGWTALFVHARGLVVEQGGVLSHGAIVARDFGIPAVVCPDATRRIPDKTTVRVDGNRGRITLLDET